MSINISLDVDEVSIKPCTHKQITVNLDGVQNSDILINFTISDILDHFKEGDILDHIGVDEVKSYFGLVEIE